MSIQPSRQNCIILQGKFDFTAKMVSNKNISDTYSLKIIIPNNYPVEIPKVYELDNKIPRDGNHHINPDDSLCLGSPFRIQIIMSQNTSIVNFAEKILIPYLFAMSHQRLHGGSLMANELAHGRDGIVEDYKHIFGLKSIDQIRDSFTLLSKKRRIANKMLCPCGCGKVLGRCCYHKLLNQYRNVTFRGRYQDFLKELE